MPSSSRCPTTVPLLLMVLLIAFPQLSETIYAPILPNIASAFNVDASTAQLTMSVYFVAFAMGVVAWGRMADRHGRRPAMLAGLACYVMGACAALLATDFIMLLAARVLLAFGASAGSVVVQTVMRDQLSGARLASAFSVIGAALSLSPALGPPSGALLAMQFGHMGAFALLAIVGVTLFLATRAWLPETRPVRGDRLPALLPVARRIVGDHRLWVAASRVAGFNLILFGFYTLAPFTLTQMGWPVWVFGATGLAVAFGSLMGAWLNRRLLRHYAPAQLVRWAIAGSVFGAALQVGWIALSGHSTASLAGLVVCQFLLMLAYGCAIPNLLATALDAYGDVRGSAGALFGLCYYLMLAAGLGLVGILHAPVALYQPLAILAITVLLGLTLAYRPVAAPVATGESAA